SPGSSSFATETVAADQLDEAGFAPGMTTPYEVLVQSAHPDEVAAELTGVDGVVAAIAPEGDAWRRDGSALVLVLPESGESAGAGRDTVEAVRDVAHALPGEARVGGSIAA